MRHSVLAAVWLAALMWATAEAQSPHGGDDFAATQEAESSGAGSRYDGRARDAIDASAPHDAQAAKWLQQAESLLAQQRWDRVRELLLHVLGQAEGAMVRLQGGQLVSVAEEANALLGRLPPDLLDLYRREYGLAAEKLLAEGIASGRRETIEKVATQFQHTAAGKEALRRLAAIHFDRGEFGLAARRYRQLDEKEFDRSLRLRAAYAYAASGDRRAAEQLIAGMAAEDLFLPNGLNLADVLATTAKRAVVAPEVDDWQLPFGDATGAALVRPGEPLLISRWFHPLTYRASLQEQIDRTTTDLRDAGRATIPTSVPLAIGDLLVSRTLRGISVRSLPDGRLLWETEEKSSPELLLTEGSLQTDAEAQRVMRLRGQFGLDPSFGASGDQQPLTDLLYRDGVFGHLSSDGERIYVVEENPAPVRLNAAFGWEGQGAAVSSSSNRIVAYDLISGRLAWPRFGALGGVAEGGPFTPPLAGYFFFGPPTPVGDELFAIGERNKEIRLLSLDPASGSVRWDCLLAYAQVGIEQDPVRRHWPTPMAGAGGVLVCPTNVGWVVGVDRSSRSILWAHRYAPQQRNGRDGSDAGPAAAAVLNSRWSAAAPIIRGRRVLFAPADEARLLCLDLHSGELNWQRGKAGHVYIAGTTSEQLAILVGTGAIEAIDLERGGVRWSLPIPDDAGRPSGRGFLTKDFLYLPIHGEELWQIQLKEGARIREMPLPEGSPSLGNLLLHRGTLLSYSSDGLAAFEERTELVRDVEQRLRELPHNSPALLRKAELLRAEGESNDAVEILKKIDLDPLSPVERERFFRLRWDIHVELVRSAPEAAAEHLQTLSEIAQSPEEQLTVRRLTAEWYSAVGDFDQAARAYLDLLRDVELRQHVSEDGGRRNVRIDVWLAGHLRDLWQIGPREKLSEIVEEALQSATSNDDRARLARLLSFHPAAAVVLRKQAHDAAASSRLAESELQLLRLVAHEDVSIAAAAMLDLSEISMKRGLPHDALYWLERAARHEADLILPEGGRLASRLNDLRGEVQAHPTDFVDWGHYRLMVVRSGGYTSQEPSVELRADQTELPFFRNRRLTLLTQQERLAVSGPGGGGLDHLIPLRASARPGPGTRAIVTADGHLLFVLTRGVVQAIAPTEGRVLWSAAAPDESRGAFTAESSPKPMRPASSLASTDGLIARARTHDAMPVANASYVALRSRNELTILDAATGELRWRRTDLPTGADIVGTNGFLYIVPRDANRRLVLRAEDGRPVPVPQAAKRVPSAVAVLGDRLLTVVAEEPFRIFDLPIRDFRFGRSIVSLFDPLAGETLWSRSFASDALFSSTEDGKLCVLEPNGKLSQLDPATGELSLLGRIPADSLRRRSEAILLADTHSVYLVVNSGGRGGGFHTPELPAVSVDGEVFGFDRSNGGLRWRREVSGKRLLIQEFNQQPVLLFTNSEMTERANQRIWRTDLLALDKRSGEPVLDAPHYSTSTPFFRSLTVRPERRSLELSSYQGRLRLQAVDVSADGANELRQSTTDMPQ